MKLRSVAIAAAAMLALAACSSGTDDTAASGPLQVKYYSVQQPTEGWPLVFGKLTDDYAKTKPGTTLKVEVAPQADLDQKLQLLASQNNLPTIFNAPNSNELLQQMYNSGQILDLEATLKELGVFDKLNPAAVELVKKTQGGKLLGLPLELNIEGVWYNKKLFADNGITAPTTWEELSAAAAALQAKGVQPFAASGQQGWPLTRLLGNYLFRTVGPNALQDVKDGKAKLTDPQYVAAAQAVADLGTKGYFGKGVGTLDYATAQDLFLQGKAAMFYMGSWAVRDFGNQQTNKIGADNIGFLPFPTVAGGTGTADQTPMNAGLTTVVSKKGYNAEVGAWLKYIVEHYGDRALSEIGLVSGFTANPPADASALTKGVVTQIGATKQPLLWFEALFPTKATDTATKNVTRLVTGDMSPADYMNTLQKAIDQG
ncbi:ABC transporter substrate-binding protein [Hamadaea tsunoensis]|uniref:ABC transporter substrate-binding protein n=1 Tax=Hamadaea tsunoensis TaxID=53368 RepID=UPI000422C985|nr:extracellular solute-binding protein [Hamadaea tsunoensis]